MNKSFIKKRPAGDFKEVSALLEGWETEMRDLAARQMPIHFDMYPKRKLPEEIQSILSRHGYHDQIIENDRWQHFLVPVPPPPNADQHV